MARFITRIAAASAWFAALALATTPAVSADSLCGTRSDIVSKLAEHYKEAPQAVGMVDQNAVLEIFVSDNGTWTILATGTDGNSCVLSSGDNWQSTGAIMVAGKDA